MVDAVTLEKQRSKEGCGDERQAILSNKSRKDDICDFLLLTSWFICAMKQSGVQI
jgi:hypothetical protein